MFLTVLDLTHMFLTVLDLTHMFLTVLDLKLLSLLIFRCLMDFFEDCEIHKIVFEAVDLNTVLIL
jgi:hypothetical protein